MPAPTPPTLEAQRHAEQLAFIASGAPLVVGDARGLPWALDHLRAITPASPEVLACIDSGLTAVVYRLFDGTRHWTLKRARPEARVRNIDGQTSFLNEVQRRADLERLKAQPGGAARWAAFVDTRYASFRDGLILSPWIEGSAVHDWDARRLAQVLDAACALWAEGLFEWDLCGGNLLDDGTRMRLFDFGYMYRFDPLRQFNSAGHGDDEPLFHPAERFETRHFCAVLLRLEQQHGPAAALAAFRLEKGAACAAYLRLHATMAARGAQSHVLDWLAGHVARWTTALQGDLAALYRAENWRSHALDLDDDLRGQSCTPTTLARADWLLAALREDFDALRAQGAFFWADEGCDASTLAARYTARRAQAAGWQRVLPD